MSVYKEKDYVEVFDEAGNSQGTVPKAWVGTDLLLDGVKPRGRGRPAKAEPETKSDDENKDA